MYIKSVDLCCVTCCDESGKMTTVVVRGRGDVTSVPFQFVFTTDDRPGPGVPFKPKHGAETALGSPFFELCVKYGP